MSDDPREATQAELLLRETSGLLQSLSAARRSSEEFRGVIAQLSFILNSFCPQVNEHLGVVNPHFNSSILTSCNEQGLLKTVERIVPEGIFPDGWDVVTSNVRPNARRQDDEMYNKHELLRRMIPRGVAVLSVKKSGQTNAFVDIIIYALAKFTGKTIEDDDDHEGKEHDEDEKYKQSDPEKYFLKNPTFATRVFGMDKINGEAAHFSGRFINGNFYLIAGSKNVHLIFQTKEHIELYVGDNFSIARTIAETLLVRWNKLREENKSYFSKFLHFTRTTVVMEIMMPSHQHVVYFDGLEENKLVCLALTPPPPRSDIKHSFTAMPTDCALLLLYILGFDVANFEILPSHKVEDHQLHVRKMQQSEGFVYYYEDINGHVFGLMKLKTIWYVHLRALRQQASYRYRPITGKKPPKQKTLDESKQQSRRRIEELQLFLLTTDEELKDWQQLSDEWFDYLEVHVTENEVYEAKEVRYNFPTVWQPFIKYMQESSNDRRKQLLDSLHLCDLSLNGRTDLRKALCR